MKLIAFHISVSADHPALPGHFPGLPIVPGVVLLDRLLDAVEQATGQRVARLEQVKFLRAVRPDQRVDGCCSVDGTRIAFRLTAPSDAAAATVATGTLSLRAGPEASA